VPFHQALEKNQRFTLQSITTHFIDISIIARQCTCAFELFSVGQQMRNEFLKPHSRQRHHLATNGTWQHAGHGLRRKKKHVPIVLLVIVFPSNSMHERIIQWIEQVFSGRC
jgi:hypothetical protein